MNSAQERFFFSTIIPVRKQVNAIINITLLY